jgi:hypothetical protein
MVLPCINITKVMEVFSPINIHWQVIKNRLRRPSPARRISSIIAPI